MFRFNTINLGWSIIYIKGSQSIISNIIVFLSLKIFLSLIANSADPDEMLQFASFHLGLLCLPKIVSMIRKYHNHKPQTKPRHRKEEAHNHHETPGRQTKQSNQLSHPHQDDCKTRMGIK